MTLINGELYREVRCSGCKHFIVYEKDTIGTLAYKCPKCSTNNMIKLTMLKTKANINKMNNYLIQPKGGEK